MTRPALFPTMIVDAGPDSEIRFMASVIGQVKFSKYVLAATSTVSPYEAAFNPCCIVGYWAGTCIIVALPDFATNSIEIQIHTTKNVLFMPSSLIIIISVLGSVNNHDRTPAMTKAAAWFVNSTASRSVSLMIYAGIWRTIIIIGSTPAFISTFLLAMKWIPTVS